MNLVDWTNLRATLHHDWLQKYFVFLNAREDILDKVAFGKSEWRNNIKEQFLEWDERKELFKKLLEASEEALSPRQLLNESPLDVMSEPDKEWLGEVIHELYLKKTHIRETIFAIKNLFGEANEAFEGILHGKSERPSPSGNFKEKLTAFSKEISKLPHTLQVV